MILVHAQMQSLLAQVFLTPEYLAISMEYAKGGDMFQYVKAKGGLQVKKASWEVSRRASTLYYPAVHPMSASCPSMTRRHAATHTSLSQMCWPAVGAHESRSSSGSRTVVRAHSGRQMIKSFSL